MKTVTLVASATLAIAVSMGGASAVPVPALAACDPPTRALQYLAANQKPDGSIDESLGETADYVLGAAADGVDPNTLKSTSGTSVYDWFASDLGKASPTAYQNANQLGKLVQAVVAGGHDPAAFAGQDLLTKLTSTGGAQPFYNAAMGAFLDGFGGQNQAFTNAQAILALVGANQGGFPVPAPALSELKSLRATSGAAKGGWPAFAVVDTNTTSMALMALTAAGDSASSDPGVYSDAFGFLHSQQDHASGGFPFSTTFGSASDPDSDALVIQALVASGQDPAAAAWTNSAGSATSDVLTFQDSASGGLAFAHGGAAQTFATSQVPAGLRRAPFPVQGAFSAGASIPAAGCPAPPSPTTTATGAPEGAATGALPGLPRVGEPPLPRADSAQVLRPAAAAIAGVVLVLLLAGAGWAGLTRRAKILRR